MSLDLVYGEIFNNIEESNDWSVIVHCLFNLCDRRDKEPHEHLQWFMQLQEDGSIVYSNPDNAKRALELIRSPRAKYSDFIVRAIFTDELVSGDPVTVESLQDFSNLFHFINSWKFGGASDRFFKIFEPVSGEDLALKIDGKKNEIIEEPLGRLFWKDKDLKKAVVESRGAEDIKFRLALGDAEYAQGDHYSAPNIVGDIERSAIPISEIDLESF